MKDNILAVISAHGKCDIAGLYAMFPHIKKILFYRLLLQLRNEGWIKIRKTRTVDGYEAKWPNVSRTPKQKFVQQELFS